MICVAGAGGFIGGHLVRALLERGERVAAVDIKPFDEWHQLFARDALNYVADLRRDYECRRLVAGASEVYNLATDMGGIGYLEANRLDPMISVLINTHLLMAAKAAGVRRYFFSSSACIYGQGANTSVKESDAYPAHCEDGYGWEKLFSERLCKHFNDAGLETRVARYHNVYGPYGTWEGGREKAPAALSRKVATAVRENLGEIEIWGDGSQLRSFMHIDDCIEGTLRIMRGDSPEPVNLGSDEVVSINWLADLVQAIAGTDLSYRYDRDAPQGVQGRNSDNTLIKARYDWAPEIDLATGMRGTYHWIAEQVGARVHA